MIQRNAYVTPLINPSYVTGLFLYPPENIRKPLVFRCFQGGKERAVA